MERENTKVEWFFIFILISAFLVHIVALFGVLLYRVWSRTALLYTSLLLYLLTPFWGPYVAHGLSATLDNFSSFILGALLALLFFGQSPFNKPNSQETVSNSS